MPKASQRSAQPSSSGLGGTNIALITFTIVAVAIAVAVSVFFPSTFNMLSEHTQTTRVVVVGGGLAGLSAAIEAERAGAHVVILDKEARLGGNSAKATSGINGVPTEWQAKAGIHDTVDFFKADTIKSGDGLNLLPLVDVLVHDSKDAVDFLTSFGVDLSEVSRCGGHGVPRTHRAKPTQKPMNIGMEIISKMLAAVNAKKETIEVLTQAKVTSLLTDLTGAVSGVKYEKDGQEHTLPSRAVILTCGGYSADRAGFLRQHAPHLENVPTTNGPFATGDGVRMGAAVGAHLLHMDKVQVHPTAFINPADPNNPTKFLAAEALRAVGGVMLNSNGRRFTNELGRRDHTSDAILRSCTPLFPQGTPASFLILNAAAVSAFGEAAVGFYTSKGFFQQFEHSRAFAEKYGIDPAVLAQTLETYNKNVDGTPDEFGKDFFPTKISPDEAIHVSIITPAVHYTMGGLEIDPHAKVMSTQHGAIPRLYGAGELTAGIHGQNRLAGNSLLECVVFGRIAGRNAAHEQPQQD